MKVLQRLICGEVGWKTGGCGEESHNHEELHNGWGLGGEGLSRWGCFL